MLGLLVQAKQARLIDVCLLLSIFVRLQIFRRASRASFQVRAYVVRVGFTNDLYFGSGQCHAHAAALR